ncbi:MAG: hypothetical protein QOE58_642 [Actinomycetota bacterium]|nr:hypothetical protein [Actinomycetota bacterium]
MIARVGSDGKVALYNGSAGTVQLSADIVGYFKSGAAPPHHPPHLTTVISTATATATTYDTALVLTASVSGDLGKPIGEVKYRHDPVTTNGILFTGSSSGRLYRLDQMQGQISSFVEPRPSRTPTTTMPAPRTKCSQLSAELIGMKFAEEVWSITIP